MVGWVQNPGLPTTSQLILANNIILNSKAIFNMMKIITLTLWGFKSQIR